MFVIEAEKQTQWAFNPFFEQFSRSYLVVLQENIIVGFLMFVVWETGPHDRGHPLIKINGKPLTEAKIIAFGVPDVYRRQGIGRHLQNETIVTAKQLGCYQIRSVSDET